MATAEYHRKQVELLLVWAMATAEPVLKAKLVSRALEFLALIDDADDRLLRCRSSIISRSNWAIAATSPTSLTKRSRG